MRVLDGALAALLLGLNAVLAADNFGSSVMFTTVRINTAICHPTGGANGGGNGTGGGGGNGGGGTGVSTSAISTDYGAYDFLGFFPIPDQATVLKRAVSSSFTSSSLTLEECGNFCDGSQFFAVQFGDLCTCSATGPTTTPSQIAVGLIPCGGDSTEVCGAPGYAVVYERQIDITGGGTSTSSSGGASETVVVTGTTTDSTGIVTFTSTEVISSAPSIASETIIVTGTSTASTGVVTFTSTEVISSAPSVASETIIVTGTSTDSTGVVTFTSTEAISSVATDTESTGVLTSTAVGSSSSSSEGASSTTGASSSSAISGSSTSAGASSSSSTEFGTSSTDTSGTSSTGTTASSTSASASPSSSTFATDPCPGSDGQVVAIGGTNYNIQCGTNYVGLPDPNDLTNPDAATFSECLEFCNTYVPSQAVANGGECVAVTYGVGGTNSCYLKFQVEEVDETQSGYDSAYKQSYSPANASTIVASSTATTGSSSGTAISGTSSLSTTGGSSSSTTGASSNSTGSSATSTTGASSTSTAASSTTTTAASSTSTTTASSTSSTTASSTSTSGSSSTSSAATPEMTDATTPVCPLNNHTIYVDPFTYSYNISCGLSLQGNALLAVHADTFDACLQYCDLHYDCAGVNYADGAASTSTNCYPLSTFTGYDSQPADAGIYGGVPLLGPSGGDTDAEEDFCAGAASGSTQSQTDIGGNAYTIGCGANLPGNDLPPYQGFDLDSCMNYCTLYSACIAVDFVGYPTGQTGANCYPKSGNLGSPDTSQTTIQYARQNPPLH